MFQSSGLVIQLGVFTSSASLTFLFMLNKPIPIWAISKGIS